MAEMDGMAGTEEGRPLKSWHERLIGESRCRDVRTVGREKTRLWRSIWLGLLGRGGIKVMRHISVQKTMSKD